MVEALRLRVGLLAALLAVLATCAVASVSPTQASAAGNAQFCWGQWLQSHNQYCHTGFGVSNLTQIVGSGAQHSVCVWAYAGRTMCSPGPLQAVYNTSMAGCGFCGIPSINNNGYSPNQVYGRFYWS
jgi:uncharacterized membrane protein